MHSIKSFLVGERFIQENSQVEHILTIISVSGLIAVGCQAFIADENMIYWPETLLNVVISHIHYAPDSWKGRAHTGRFCFIVL